MFHLWHEGAVGSTPSDSAICVQSVKAYLADSTGSGNIVFHVLCELQAGGGGVSQMACNGPCRPPEHITVPTKTIKHITQTLNMTMDAPSIHHTVQMLNAAAPKHAW